MNTFLYLLIFQIFFLFFTPLLSHSQPDRFLRRPLLHGNHRQEFLEISYPPPPQEPTPSCSHKIIHHSFANTMDSPPYTTHYTPPSHCPPPWSRAVLRFHVKSKGNQYDRIAAIWLGGAELLRTSTAEPTDSGIFWDVRKDVTRYSSLLSRSDLDLTMMLENIVNREFTGVYYVTVTLLLYKEAPVNPAPRSPERLNLKLKSNRGSISQSRSLMGESKVTVSTDVYDSPADLIIPISDDGERGFWFRVEDDRNLHSRKIQIPRNTQRVVLELCVSFHGNDEFWYSNPPNSYITENGLSTGRGNGAYREVYVTIDGEIVGWEVPFPVIFTGGINPLFWEPVVAIGAFNLPSYDIDLTPFLGKILDGKDHIFGIGVVRGISFWLVNANLHLWLDHESEVVQANRVTHRSPETSVERQEEFVGLDGDFQVEAEKETHVAGWVSTSKGNITTVISQEFAFSNFIKFQRNGTYKMVKQKFKAKKKMKVTNEKGTLVSRLKVRRKYPLKLLSVTEPLNERYRLYTNFSHGLEEKYIGMRFLKSISNSQDSNGWIEVKGHDVLSGQASTKQNYSYADRFNCYSRDVATANGKVFYDGSSIMCENSL